MAKVLRQTTVSKDIPFDNLKEEVEEFAKKWAIDISDVNVEAEDYPEWGDTFCRLNIYAYSEPSAEEFEAMEKRTEEVRAMTRARKLEQLEQLKKELGRAEEVRAMTRARKLEQLEQLKKELGIE